MVNNEKLEDLAMLIIANAGAARTEAFGSLSAAKKGDFARARGGLEKAKDYSRLAHEAHSELLKLDAKGEVQQVDLLLSHSQDHLMNAALAIELISEIIDLHEIVQGG